MVLLGVRFFISAGDVSGAGAPDEQLGAWARPTAVLMFQIVSTLLSGCLLLTLGPRFLERRVGARGGGWLVVSGWLEISLVLSAVHRQADAGDPARAR
jgi:hypothetical protein